MKRSMILTAVLTAMLLTGCNRETELIDELEASEITASEQTNQDVQTGSVTAETSGDTQYILGGETETSIGTNQNQDNIQESEDTENYIAAISSNVFDYGSLNTDTDENENTIGNLFIKDNILCADYSIESETEIQVKLRFYDIAENELLSVIDVPEGWGTYEMISDTVDGILCKLVIFTTDEITFNNQFAVMTIYSDFTYDISDGYTPQDSSFECCGHNIVETETDIIDADSGDVLVEGKAATSDDDFSGTRPIYYFPVDENRFVYRMVGYESLLGFGIYDFSEGIADAVPDSKELIPLGVHGGKIYSVKTALYGFGTELYTTDTETLETEFFMDFPIELEMNDFVECAMPESGRYIALKYLPADEESPAQLYGIDPDTKEFIVEDIPDDLKYYTLKRSTENRVTVSNNQDKVLIAEINI